MAELAGSLGDVVAVLIGCLGVELVLLCMAMLAAFVWNIIKDMI